ncbi:helicase-associated domain-containing protein [Streptomyces aidingensis]|nr:helicase-associated domain-containing protein [Streptomyces aidingensis]
MSTDNRGGAPRTLADELRALPDDALAELLRLRPDLLSPLPGDLSRLAARAGTRPSVLRALERLDTFTLQTAEALAVAAQPCPAEALARLLPGGERRLPAALAALRGRALLWGPDQALRLVRTARELLAPSPGRPGSTGLGPTLAEATAGFPPSRMQELLAATGLPSTHDPVSALRGLEELFADPRQLDKLLAVAPERARAALEKLIWGPPYGELSPQPAPHLRWLLERGLLIPVNGGGPAGSSGGTGARSGGMTVVLPREAALTLRGGRAHRAPSPLPPEVTVRARYTPEEVDRAAAGQAHTALTVVEELLSRWEQDGPAVLRAGGLGVRDLRRLATTLELPAAEAAFWAELAYAAGLVASDGEADERWAPTPAADEWRELPPERRWAALVLAWLRTTRVPGLIGRRPPAPAGPGGPAGQAGRDQRPPVALGPGLDRGPAAELRLAALRLLTALEPGAAADPEAVRHRLRWEAPRRMPEELHTLLTAAVLADAERLGVTGRGAPAAPVRPLLAALTPDDTPAAPAAARGAAGDAGPDPEAAVAAALAESAALLAPLLPEPLDEVLLQADLTAVAPGPLRRELAQALAVAADIESKGGATVYRFAPGSVRRALDAGWSAAELREFLARHSRTPVPQPLAYLIDDVARKHGLLRVGAATSYLRCDDETLLTQLLADRRAAALRLRRLAPTVLLSPVAPEVLLQRLRELGHAPAAESAEGAVLAPRRAAHRTPPRSAPEPVPDGPPPADRRLLAAAVRAVRAGDHAATAAPAAAAPSAAVPEGVTDLELPRRTAAETLSTLRAAAHHGGLVRIGYVGADGVAGRRVLAPVRVEGGLVTAFDHTAEEIRTYPLHRITGAAALGTEP